MYWFRIGSVLPTPKLVFWDWLELEHGRVRLLLGRKQSNIDTCYINLIAS